MAFLNVRFPLDISLGAVGGPGFSTQIVTLGSGDESRNGNWAEARCSWDVAKACRKDIFRARLIAFFRIAMGKLHGFLFRDFTDYTVRAGEGFFQPSGVEEDEYQLIKRYTNSAGSVDRFIQKPSFVQVFDAGGNLLQAGVDYTIDMTLGLVTMIAGSLADPPATWVGEFDCAARFDIDKLPLNIEDPDFWRATSIQIVEIRVRRPD